MRKQRSLDQAYFEALYQRDPDPWRFATSDYEREKYEATLLALGDERAGCALEVGCSIGVLTQKLATLCDALVSTDLSSTALAEARRRCAALAQVQFRHVSSAAGSFQGRFDLIVLSEVVYYWDDPDLSAVAQAMKDARIVGGRILLVHWLGETDFPRSADDAVDGLAAALGRAIDVETAARNHDYRLDVWRWR